MFQIQSPFPFTLPTGVVVTDERCKCGALRSQHENTVAYGHGPRLVGDPIAGYTTACTRFTWIAHVFTTMNVPAGFVALDDRHVIKVERANKRSIGAKGWRYEVRDMAKAPPRPTMPHYGAKLFTSAAPAARSKAQAIEHARIELHSYNNRRASMTVLDGGAL